MNSGGLYCPGCRKLPSNPPCRAETKIKPSTFELVEYLLFSVGFYFTANGYIVGLQSKFVVAIVVRVFTYQKNYKLIYPLADYIFTAGLVEGLGDLISWETAPEPKSVAPTCSQLDKSNSISIKMIVDTGSMSFTKQFLLFFIMIWRPPRV